MNKAIVLVSGGINSAVAAAIAREHHQPALLHANWGHRTAERELSAFKDLASAIKIEQTRVVDLTCLAAIGGNARVNKRIAVEDASALGQETPATFVFGLMPSLLSIAAAWAGAIGASRIVLGTSENLGVFRIPMANLYPDYKREFIQTFNLMLQYAKPRGREVIVEAPLLELNRAEIIRLGDLMDVPFEKTWSCYVNNDNPCGRCLGCTTRAAGFIKANRPDPLLHAATATA